MSRIVMAMSGGVDSSVAAALLTRAGHDVIGVFMRHGEPEVATCSTAAEAAKTVGQLPIVQAGHAHKHGCCTAADAEDARRIAQQLDIPFYALNLSDDFARIIDYFVDEYSAARTPNPCVMCNNWLKFGKLFEYADSVGAEFVATGHYARVQGSGFRNQESGVRSQKSEVEKPGTLGGKVFSRVACDALLRGVDESKDQSYVLFGVDKKFLPRMMLPIGEYRKDQIRELAQELGLRVANKPDSQDICFVTSGEHADFVRRRRSQRGGNSEEEFDSTGEIALADGTVVGRHDGIESFTIGQRKGLRVAMGEPYYVVHIDAESRRVVIGQHHELARNELTANRSNWLADPPAQPLRCFVKIRYNSPATAATVEPLNADRFRVQFDEPRHGVAPGQAVVCYDGDRVLGGGWIE